MLVRNLRRTKVVYWVSVSESSGTSLSGLSRIQHHCCFIVATDFLFLIALTSTVLIVSEVRKLMSQLILRRHSSGSADVSPRYYSVSDYV